MPEVIDIMICSGHDVRGVFAIEMALSEEQCRMGLMFRRQLGRREGMFIRNLQKGPMSIWMKDTFLALDLVFIDSEWRVATRIKNVAPETEVGRSSITPAIGALELGAGVVEETGIARGDALFRRP